MEERDVETKKSAPNQEYFDNLENWLKSYHEWCQLNKFLYQTAVASCQVNSIIYNAHQQSRQRNGETQQNGVPNSVPNGAPGTGGQIFIIAPLWKRFLAEGIDFFILSFFKLIFQLFISTFDIIPLKNHDLRAIKESLSSDLSEALDMTWDIFLLELIYRVIVCTFETYFLAGGSRNSGGATPGKFLMGIRVVTATLILPIPERAQNHVLVYPATNLGYLNAFYRSLFKNIVLMVFFPMCHVTYFFNFNRTGYDVFSHSVVVQPL